MEWQAATFSTRVKLKRDDSDVLRNFVTFCAMLLSCVADVCRTDFAMEGHMIKSKRRTAVVEIEQTHTFDPERMYGDGSKTRGARNR